MPRGQELHNSRIVDQAAPRSRESEEAAPKHGKRVVEITQPARRPARMERMAEERRREVVEAAADFVLGITDSPVPRARRDTGRGAGRGSRADRATTEATS